MKKTAILFAIILLIAGCGNAVPTNTEIPPVQTTASEGLNKVTETQCSLISDSSTETVTLYTSAPKENGRFEWDDHARWLLEIASENGDVYTVLDSSFSNGSIYFDILEIDSNKYIFVRNISTASDSTTVFTFKDGKLTETNEIDLNGMKDKAVNLIFTSTPNYR